MGHEFKFEVIPLTEEIVNPQLSQNQPPPVVLVVDDEPLIVDSLGAILASSGLKILKAYNGAAALELAITHAPQLMLTDVAMPGMNGIDLAMAVADAMPDCKVMLFSAHASTLDLSRARAAGFDFPLVGKPIHPREMIERVFGCLGAQPAAPRPRRAYPESTLSAPWHLAELNG